VCLGQKLKIASVGWAVEPYTSVSVVYGDVSASVMSSVVVSQEVVSPVLKVVVPVLGPVVPVL